MYICHIYMILQVQTSYDIDIRVYTCRDYVWSLNLSAFIPKRDHAFCILQRPLWLGYVLLSQ